MLNRKWSTATCEVTSLATTPPHSCCCPQLPSPHRTSVTHPQHLHRGSRVTLRAYQTSPFTIEAQRQQRDVESCLLQLALYALRCAPPSSPSHLGYPCIGALRYTLHRKAGRAKLARCFLMLLSNPFAFLGLSITVEFVEILHRAIGNLCGDRGWKRDKILSFGHQLGT